MKFPFVLAGMPAFLIPIILVAGFGVIVLVVILLKRHVKIFKSDEQPKSDKEIAEEELNRILEPVEELTPKEEKAEEEPKAEEKPEEPKAEETPKAEDDEAPKA